MEFQWVELIRERVKYMLRKLLLALLNGVITLVVLQIIVVILGMVGMGAIGAVLAPFVFIIALLVAALTFFGVIPNMWPSVI